MITERAMLAAVHISIWTAVKHDRKVSRDVAHQHGAHEGAGRYNKQLLRGAEKLDALRTLAGQIRQHFYKITLPWSDEGYRLLPAHFYFELTTQMREFERAFSQSVDEFLEVYPSYIEQVRPELNGLFREEDYPSAEKLRAKFGVKLEVLPIPSGDDFRVTLSEEEQARVAREIDESVRAVAQPWNQGPVGAADGRGHTHGRQTERAGVAIPCFAGHQRLRPRRSASTSQREPGRGTESVCSGDQGSPVQLQRTRSEEERDSPRCNRYSDAAQILSQMDAVLRGREQDSAEANDKLHAAERAKCRGDLLAHVGVYGGGNAMTKHLTPAVRIQKARTALLLDHPFFGSLLFRLGGRASGSIQTMATDGVSLFYNPAFVETLNAAELAGVLAHEVMHPALQHHTRRGDRDRKRWNMACDYAINPLLLDAGLTLPKDVLIDHRFRGMSAERIYNLIEEQRDQDSSNGERENQDGASSDGEGGEQRATIRVQIVSLPHRPHRAALARCLTLLSPKETTATPWLNRRGNGR